MENKPEDIKLFGGCMAIAFAVFAAILASIAVGTAFGAPYGLAVAALSCIAAAAWVRRAGKRIVAEKEAEGGE